MNLNIVYLEHYNKEWEKLHYKHSTDAGFDFRYAGTESIELKFGERALIPTGIKMAIPAGYELQIRPRSGLAAKNGISIINTPGTIDSNYRGEIMIILSKTSKNKVNESDETPFVIKPGMRIAQGVFGKVIQFDFVETDNLDETSRGEGGFGSTGTK